MADLAALMYGSASQAEQSQGAGLPQAVQTGASLVLKKQELDMQTQGMQLKMQQLQQAKIQKNYDFLEAAHKYTNAGDRNNLIKAGMGLRDASGLTSKDIPDSVYTGMGSDDNMGRDVTARQMVQAGLMTPEQYFKAKADPQTWAQLPVASPESYNMADTDISSTIKDVAARHQAAQEAQANRENLQKVAQIKASGQQGFKPKDVTDAQKNQETQLAPELKKSADVGPMMDARDRILNSLKSDPSGKSATPQDLSAVLFPLLHSAMGRVTEAEITKVLGMPGLAGMTQNQITQKLVGGVNPNAAKAIIGWANDAAKGVDSDMLKKADSITDAIDAMPGRTAEQKSALKSGLKSLVKTNYRPMPGEGQMYTMSNGKSYSADQLKTLRSNPNVSPQVAAEIDAKLGTK